MRATRRLIRGAVLLAAVTWAGTARADIYRWTDAEGRLHFTEKLDQVPPEHRAEAQRGAEAAPPEARVQIYSSPSGGEAHATSPPGEIRVPFAREGSLMRVDVRLNDLVTAPFYVDTGASGVSLPWSVAQQLGLGIGRDTPHVQVSTANGIVARPIVRLDSVQLGAARVEGLSATVNPSMQVGLLGGDFFNNFVYRVDAAESVITLAPNEQMRGGLGAEEWRSRFNQVRSLIERVESYLARPDVQSEQRAQLERRHQQLLADLDALEREANRLGVPHGWRR
jgi:clan AA aspartic protease (TIGR02281 family)